VLDLAQRELPGGGGGGGRAMKLSEVSKKKKSSGEMLQKLLAQIQELN
jgi:hypothetical protein